MSWFSISRITATLSTQISTCDLFDGCWGTIRIAGMSVSWMTSQNKVRGRLIDPSVVGRVGCFFSPNASGKLWLLTLNMFLFFNFNSFQLFGRLELSSYPALRDAKWRPWFLFKERTCGVAWGDYALLDTALLFGGFFILASNCQENMTQGMPRDPSFSGLGRQLIAWLSDSLIVSYHDGTRSRSDPALRKSLQWAADGPGVSPDETSLSTVAGGDH